jgi:hypothetical protein
MDESMDRIVLWALLMIGIILFCFSLRKPLIKDTLLVFLLKAYFSSFFGIIVAEEKLIEYPVRFLGQYFDTSILFEFCILLCVCIFTKPLIIPAFWALLCNAHYIPLL